jgi:hypothetical protein
MKRKISREYAGASRIMGSVREKNNPTLPAARARVVRIPSKEWLAFAMLSLALVLAWECDLVI